MRNRSFSSILIRTLSQSWSFEHKSGYNFWILIQVGSSYQHVKSNKLIFHWNIEIHEHIKIEAWVGHSPEALPSILWYGRTTSSTPHLKPIPRFLDLFGIQKYFNFWRHFAGLHRTYTKFACQRKYKHWLHVWLDNLKFTIISVHLIINVIIIFPKVLGDHAVPEFNNNNAAKRPSFMPPGAPPPHMTGPPPLFLPPPPPVNTGPPLLHPPG